MRARSALARAAGLVALLLPLGVGLVSGRSLRIYPGPADPAYSVDLPARFRVGEPTFFRWLGRGGVDLPWSLRTAGALELDYQIATPSIVKVLLEDRPVGEMQLRPGASPARLVLPGGPGLRLRFLEGESDAEDRRRASFFRIQIQSSGLVPTLEGGLIAAALPLLLYALLATAGLSDRDSFGLALVASILEAAFLAADPYVALRLVERLLPPVALFGGLVAALLRRTRWPAWCFAAFLAGLLLRLSIVLHPFAYHYDHQAHAGMVQAILDRGVVGFLERQEELQLDLNVGAIEVGGAKRAFPYPAFLYLVSAAIARVLGSVDYALMLFSALTASLETILVASLAGMFDERARAYSAWAAALYPASFGVLTLALYPTVVAHVFELGALALLAWRLPNPSKKWSLALSGSIALAASIHAGSFINLAAFLPFLALLTRSAQPLRIGALGLGASLLLSYRRLLELIPVLLASPGEAPYSSYWLQLEPPQQFAFMGGYLWPAMGIAGLALLSRSRRRSFLIAWVLSFLALRGLRVFLGPPGAHLKELQWAAPLVALGVGRLVFEIERRRPAIAAFAIALLFALSLRWVAVHERWIQPIFREEPGQRPRDTSSISKSFGQSLPVTKRRFEEAS
jgi:hypothetical protein